jgi:Mor family transcriptional regulator
MYLNKNTLRTAANNYNSVILKPFDAIMDVAGFDAVMALCETFGGTKVYIPSYKKIFRACLEREAMDDMKNRNISTPEICRKYGFSERYVENLKKQMENASS